MKIAVYTIVKNAEKYIHEWVESAKDADSLFLGDTGSTDRTVAVARRLGVKVYKIQPEEPFHFANARNAILEKIPDDVDICVCVDADERLEDGWREEVEENFDNNILYVEWIDTHTVMKSARVHPRHGAYWHGRIHELLDGDLPKKIIEATIRHERDRDRDRRFYIDLLQMELDAEWTHRNVAHLAREYAAHGMLKEAEELAVEYFSKPPIYFEEASGVCNFLYYLTKDAMWLYKSIYYAPVQKEAYERIAEYLMHNEDYLGAYHFLMMSFSYNRKVVTNDRSLPKDTIKSMLSKCYIELAKKGETPPALSIPSS